MLHPALVSANSLEAWPQPGHRRKMHGKAVGTGGLAGGPKLMAEFAAAGRTTRAREPTSASPLPPGRRGWGSPGSSPAERWPASALGEAVRRYVFRLKGAGAADVCFEDGRLFHPLNLEGGTAHVRHDCAPDQYEGRYRVLAPSCWLLSWRVTEPRKNYRMTSRFVRTASAGSGGGQPA